MSKSFKLWIEDKKTFKKVLTKMKEEGIKWQESPLAGTRTLAVPIGLFVDTDNWLDHVNSFDYYNNQNYNEITSEEYLKGSDIECRIKN